MITAFSNPNNAYNYRAITHLIGDINDTQLQLIEMGDIFLIEGFTTRLSLSVEKKALGGGIHQYVCVRKQKKLKPESIFYAHI